MNRIDVFRWRALDAFADPPPKGRFDLVVNQVGSTQTIRVRIGAGEGALFVVIRRRRGRS